MTFGFSRLRRAAAATLAALTALGLAPVLLDSSDAATGFSFTRRGGTNRFDTARLIAADSFGQAGTVLIGRGDLFPDALAGSYLAGSTGSGAPILLALPNLVPRETGDALTSLQTTRAILLGGLAALGPEVEAELRRRNITVDRVAGANRFDTAAQVAARPGAANVGTADGLRAALITSGRNFPDALAGGPVAYAAKFPTLLVEPGSLPPETRSALQSLAIRKVFILGGTAAVAQSVEDEIRGLGITIERLQGANRQVTATAIADFARAKLNFSDSHVNLARGDGFADALSGGPHGGKERGSIVLTGNPTTLTGETESFLQRLSTTLTAGHIFGGEAAVSQAVADQATRAALGGRVQVTAAPSTVPPGGTISGTITGDGIQSVTVNGCGITNQTVQRDGQGRYTLVIPSAQPAGRCDLTFTTRFADGGSETDIISITIGGSSTTGGTTGPELIQVAYIRTVSQPATPGSPNFDQSVVQFRFDEAITGQIPAATRFILYRYDRGTSPSRYRGIAARVDDTDPTAALVSFGGDPTGQPIPSDVNRPVGVADIAEITTGAVEAGAVADNTFSSGAGACCLNSEGDAPLNNVTFPEGRTAAPDLMTVGNFRPNFNGTSSLVDFNFDQPAVNRSAAGTPAPPPTAPAGQSGAYSVIQNDSEATNRPCTFVSGPSPGPNQPPATNGNGTLVHTVECTLVAGVQLTATNVARGVIREDTVADVAQPAQSPPTAGVFTNPWQAADVSTTGATTLPDLVSVTFAPEASVTGGAVAAIDQVTFTFDEAVLVNTNAGTGNCVAPSDAPAGTPNSNGMCYRVYRTDGSQIGGVGGTPAQQPQRSSTNASEVFVTFPDGTLNEAVGANVLKGAVIEATATSGLNRLNEADEVPASSGQTFNRGTTTGPDFNQCRVEVASRDALTNQPTSFRLVYVFDETVGPNPVVASFKLYGFDGVALTPGAGTAVRNSPNNKEVVVTGFTREQMQSSAVCAVVEGAVVEEIFVAPAAPAANPVGSELPVKQT